jgi:hypothetical protein
VTGAKNNLNGPKNKASSERLIRRAVRSAYGGIGYTLGFFLTIAMAFIDLRWVALEQIIAETGWFLLVTLFAPIMFAPFRDSNWIFPYIIMVGFCISWPLLTLRDWLRTRKKWRTGE